MMAINLKVRNHAEIADETLEYTKKRFAKIEQLVPEGSFTEVEFINQFGEKGGVDKLVQVDVTIPGEKNPIHLENAAHDWMTSVDVLKDRLEQYLLKRKEKIVEENRKPRPDKIV